MSILLKVRSVINIKKQPNLFKYNNVSRGISTSEKAGEAASITVENEAQTMKQKKKIRNWLTYGFDYVDQRKDYMMMHVTSFCMVTMLFWGSIFILSYYPDADNISWAAREARILVRQREVLGLPLVDPNYIDPALIKLPPDEELGDDDIII